MRAGIGGGRQTHSRIASLGSGKQLCGKVGQHPAHPRQHRVTHQPVPVARQHVAQHRNERGKRTGLSRERVAQGSLESSPISKVHGRLAHPARIEQAWLSPR